MTNAPDERLRVTYDLTCAEGEDPYAKARDIALEQTVELPDECISPAIEELIVGRVESLHPTGARRWRAVLSYDPVTVGGEVPQLLNLLFGNISLKAGILLRAIAFPPALLARFAGPTHGIDGVRSLCGVRERRPLLCAALKPLGLSAEWLAELCFQFALGGIDIIKDDHSLTNQATAPFVERVRRCQEAIARANARTGGSSLYFPNLTSGVSEIGERLELARSAGCRGVVLCPLLVGLDTVRWVAKSGAVAILAHPSLAGTFFHERHGIAPEVVLGQLFRMVGSDGVIYPNVGGRFALSQVACDAINANLRGPLGSLRPSFPVPGGGIDVARVPYWIGRYGPDTIFLIGGSLYAQPDLMLASRRLVDEVRRCCNDRFVESHRVP